MATYKVIQDIEAEDKLVGPLSLRQFIYAGVGAFLVYLCVLVVMKHAAFLVVGFAPPALFCFFFAWPWTPDQPTEVWALARIGFFFKPRRRIWDQSGAKELVTITVPKRIEKIYTNGLSQNEVKSRLSALADTIDSRGWVIKNSNINLSANATYGLLADDSDRLVSYDVMPQDVPSVDVLPADDILDEQNNPIAQQFDEMITASTKAHRQQIMERLRTEAPQPQPQPKPAGEQNDYWFLHQEQVPNGQAAPPANDVVFANPQLVQPGSAQAYGPVAATPTADDAALVAQLRAQNDAQHVSYSHLKTIQPAGAGVAPPIPMAQPAAAMPPTNPMPVQPDPAILNLANNNDLNVATIAREAHKAHNTGMPGDEVVISLH